LRRGSPHLDSRLAQLAEIERSSAPDGVDTATYLAEGEPFFGTSAAAPHVAGAIALLKERFGIFSLDQVVEILYGRAIDRGPTGKDNQYGQGRLDLIGP
jgi:subtilisin family serine protease